MGATHVVNPGGTPIIKNIAVTGDTVQLLPGAYSGLDLQDIDGINIYLKGVCTFANGITLGNTRNSNLDGKTQSGDKYGIRLGTGSNLYYPNKGNNVNNTFSGNWLPAGKVLVFGEGKTVQWNGQDATLLYKNCKWDYVDMSRGGMAYSGTYEGSKSYWNATDLVTISNVVYVGTQVISIYANSMYRLRLHDWNITGTWNGDNDQGILYLQSGNVWMWNIKRNGANFGYLGRVWQVSANNLPYQDTILWNIIDAGSIHYGTLDGRIDPTMLASTAPIPLKGGDIRMYCGTSANKQIAGYVASALVAYGLLDDQGKTWNYYIDNWFAGGMTGDGGQTNNSSLIKVAGPNVNVIRGSHCIDFAPNIAIPANYFKDQVSFVPQPNSPLANQGGVISIPGVDMSVDIYGVLRGAIWDIGAAESSGSGPVTPTTTKSPTLPTTTTTHAPVQSCAKTIVTTMDIYDAAGKLMKETKTTTTL